ncbi:MAG: hypothetical protein K6F50_02880 [Kiritimatiellae bacterium]|nr:hypothetical protein [Kiritimatiellia bacterium]
MSRKTSLECANLKQDRSLPILFAAVFAAFSAGAVTWSGDVEVPANEDVTCLDSDLANITSLKINAGATVRFATSTAHSFPITGSGTIIKEGTSTWTMTTAIPNFNGNYEIAAGVVSFGINNAFGADNGAYRVTVRSGATLESTAKAGKASSRYIHIAGSGAAGRNGALELPAISNTDDYINRIVLDDDATMFVPSGGLFFLKYTLNLAGHRLKIIGGGVTTLMDTCNVSATGEIYLEKTNLGTPALWFRSWSHSNPSYQITPSDGPIVLAGGTIYIYSGVKPIMRPLYLSGTNWLKHSSNMRATDYYCTNHANWAGAVTFTNLTGHSRLTINNEMGNSWPSACMLCVSGPISGNGMVYTYCSSSNRVALLNPANSYTLGTFIEHSNAKASTVLGYPGSIPNEDFSSVTAKVGFVDLAVADDYSRWTLDAAVRFLTGAKFQDSCRPRFTSEFTTNGVGPIKMQLSREFPASGLLGARGEVKFEGVGNTEPIGFGWREGTAHLTGPDPMLLGEVRLHFPDADTATNSTVYIDNGADVTLYITNTLYISQYSTKQARLVVANAVLKNSDVMKSDFYTGYDNKDWGGPTRGGAIFAGYYAPGILEVLDGAVISNRIFVCGYGPSSPSYSGGNGAVYQRGGKVVALGATKGHHTSCVGMGQSSSVCGYYELSGGLLEARGQFIIGGYGYGSFAQYGGHVLVSNRLDAAAGTKQTGISMATCNQGNGTLYIKKGSWDIFCGDIVFGSGDTPRTTVDFTLDGEEALFDAHDIAIYVAQRQSNGRYNINLNGGVMRCAGIRLLSRIYNGTENLTNNVLCVNFNGGTFKAGKANSDLFGYNTADSFLWTTNVAVYAGGMTIDTDGKTGITLKTPVRGAYGKGVKSIALAEPIKDVKYISSPRVIITGDGMGASAFAHFDSTNMVLDRIIVTAPGCGYTSATGTIYYGRDVYKTLTSDAGEIVLEDNENTGSFTKAGDGTLTLNATNTWGGSTVLAGGTLKAGCDWAVPTNSAVSLGGGGVLDLNGKAARISSVEYTAGGGRIINTSAAELPESFSLRTTVEDIVAGREIALIGDQDLDGVPLTVEGEEFTGLEKGTRYKVLSVSGGNLLSAPAVSGAMPPAPWAYVVRGNDVTLQYVRGTMFVVR